MQNFTITQKTQNLIFILNSKLKTMKIQSMDIYVIFTVQKL